MAKLALVSTGVKVIEPIMQIVKEMDPDTEIFNIADDSIIKAIAANDNSIPAEVFRRMTTYIVLAEQIGVDAILVTCSSISETVDAAAPFAKVPVFKIDQPMADKAISMGTRIGVAATLATTLEPTKRLLQSRAEKAGKSISLEESLCKGAFEMLQNGDAAKHDAIVRNAVLGLLEKCDVVVLAQASMARAVETLTEGQERVLTSPRLGVANVMNYFKSMK